MLTHVLLGVTPIDYSLAYIASYHHTSKGKKTATQDVSMMLEAIAIEVNAQYCKFLSVRLNKLNVASC